MEAQETPLIFTISATQKGTKSRAGFCLSAQKISLESKTRNKHLKGPHNTVIHKNPS